MKHRKYNAYLSILCWLKKSTKTEKRIETVNKRSCVAFESKKCKFKIRKIGHSVGREGVDKEVTKSYTSSDEAQTMVLCHTPKIYFNFFLCISCGSDIVTK